MIVTNDMKNTKDLKIVNAGMGWVTRDNFGCENKKLSRNHKGISSLYSRLRNDSIVLADIKNFGRFDMPSKLVCCAAALALHDSGFIYSPGKKTQKFGIIGTSVNGSLYSNERYFRDYVEKGRDLARGNLFIYTLPSSALAEAAICLGLGGPMLYVGINTDHLKGAVCRAQTMIMQGDAEAMLAVNFSETDATCYCLRQEDRAAWEMTDEGECV